MRFRGCVPILLVVVSACSSASPRPELADAGTLPIRELSPAEKAEVAAHVDRATAAIAGGRPDEAADAANAALALDARAARARAVLAMAQLQRALRADPPPLLDLNTAETELRLASQLAPDDAFVGAMHAVFLASTGHVSAAAATAEAALARAGTASPDERAVLLGFAGAYRYELGEERAAIPHLRGYVDLRPDEPAPWFQLGACLLRVAEEERLPARTAADARLDAEAAAAAFDRCVELVPADVDAALAGATATWRAAELAAEARDDQARDELRSATVARLRAIATRFPAHPEPMFRLGVVAEANDAPAEARAAYERALAIDPAHVPSLLNLAAMLDAAGAGDDAVALLQRALAADTAQPVLTDKERRRALARVSGS